jgi:hypothetical protein
MARATSELEDAKAELQYFKAEAAAAERANVQLRASVKKSRRDATVRLRVIAVVMLTAALIKIAWLSAQAPVAPVVRAAPLPALPGALPAAAEADTTDSPGTREFTRSLNRLRDAFHSLPEEDQLDVVREINEKNPDAAMACPLVWDAAGVPSLFLGDKKGDVPPSMIAALNQCASEIEKLRAEKGPPP